MKTIEELERMKKILNAEKIANEKLTYELDDKISYFECALLERAAIKKKPLSKEFKEEKWRLIDHVVSKRDRLCDKIKELELKIADIRLEIAELNLKEV